MEQNSGDTAVTLQPRTGPQRTNTITIRQATLTDVEGICHVCSAGWRDTYANLLPGERIEQAIAENYNPERVRREVEAPVGWDGWWVADDNGTIVGAGGGGIVNPGASEIFVLYVLPERRGEGIGTRLLDAITEQQVAQGATDQWVSVLRHNRKGLPFFEARSFKTWGERSWLRNNPVEQSANVRLWRYI